MKKKLPYSACPLAELNGEIERDIESTITSCVIPSSQPSSLQIEEKERSDSINEKVTDPFSCNVIALLALLVI